MALISTRGGERVRASQAILRGIAPDGGLYVPESFPNFSLSAISAMCDMSYQQRAVRVLSAFLDDYKKEEIETAVHAAYGESFDTPDIAPVHHLSRSLSVLELYHGPTLAFKDMALQLLPHLLTLAAKKNNEEREVFILVATSGDTGKAALEGFADVPGTRCAVFYPQDGVSMAQRLQMVTQEGENTHVIAVNGNFDDAQTGVKQIFADKAFEEELDKKGMVLSSANSINFGRLVPQIVYYFSAYADLINSGEIQPGDKVDFCVPTGNFGNILAGYYARRSGLPIGRLICASNPNKVLADFLSSGYYDIKKRDFHKTISPSMDILISSNLERLLFEICGRDSEQVAQWMEELKKGRFYDIGSQRLMEMQRIFYGGWATDPDAMGEISLSLRQYGYLIDPHTAVASFVQRAYKKHSGSTRHSIVVSTASPYKFGRDTLKAIDAQRDIEGIDDFKCCDILSGLTDTAVPPQIASLPTLPLLHKGTCEKDGMEQALLDAITN